MTRLRGGLLIVKQRQSSNTVVCPQVPFIERSSTILIERDDKFSGSARHRVIRKKRWKCFVRTESLRESKQQGFGRGGTVVCAAKVTYNSDIVDVSNDVLVKSEAQLSKEPC